ncbi:MAG TPA: preprotein translocase subunit SecY [Bdellovibrionales bacterium]|nr:MAG: preprotein translocase subunit SecY [Bdellovibrionales bacterium GWB1_52_6]OFZ02616.1 MAG: preprotein translocase subunit SecY [Bdellovibrionales bacterium GWA1_52_35]OFZ41809.1 MAG: preprotein translocase subunit SecY [Bdellovibrionales bacterium GWC1_52_8]HAR43855.1 preprotein translocase subunit SecY [Bdellovibrionales bacterium]HCM41474.1 preprotein translocase subunit SecY [Bdellovibrionales bacterium]
MSGADGIVKIPELRKRILFTLMMLAVYRIGVHIPTPGIDGAALATVFANMKGTIFGWFNLFSGGALEKFSIFALGVMPYISSSIIMQLLTVVWPYLHDLQKEGDQGRKKITQYTRYGTVLLCLVQGYGIAAGLEQYNNPSVVLIPGMAFKIMTTITLTAGTVFLMWVGEQMSERGIGNGISLLIYAGIAAGIPSGIGGTVSLYRSGELNLFKILLILAVIVGTFFVIIFVERGARRIPVQYAKRIVGRKVYGGQNTNLPLKVNTAGVIPPIFASSLIMFPATLTTFFPSPTMQKLTGMLQPGGVLYNVMFVGLIIFFAFFYTAVTFKTDDVAENLKKYGGFIPGIRPGQPTAQYIDYVLSRITMGGAVYISVICVLPSFLTGAMNVPFYFGGTSVLILVGVALDTVAQIETFLLTRNYDGFMKHTRLKGRAAYS